jgi:hypothetical protein
MELTDDPWGVLMLILPIPPRRPDGRGHPCRDPHPSGTAGSMSCGQGRHDKIGPYAIRPIKSGIATSNTGSALGSLSGSSSLATDLRECGALARSVCCINGILVVAKTVAPGGNDQAGQGDEGQGHGRLCWSSSHRPHCGGLAA